MSIQFYGGFRRKEYVGQCHRITRNTAVMGGKLLVSRLAAVDLIAATTTKTVLTMPCELDDNTY